ncbi:MAG: hypothetical protein LBR07_00115 [Puniceicoccales bacterium]|jgi:hypothetical protein|nr:hypothetical protein [Puniceicoccales bacterium]
MKHVDKNDKFWGENGLFTGGWSGGETSKFAELNDRNFFRSLMLTLGMFAFCLLLALIVFG